MEEIKLKISRTLFQSIIAKLQQNPNPNLLNDVSAAQTSGSYYIVKLTTPEAKGAILPILQSLHVRFDNLSAPSRRTAIHCQNIIQSINGFAFA